MDLDASLIPVTPVKGPAKGNRIPTLDYRMLEPLVYLKPYELCFYGITVGCVVIELHCSLAFTPSSLALLHAAAARKGNFSVV